jgi:hypothetical protein
VHCLAGIESISLTVPDLNGDGELDLVTVDLPGRRVSVLLAK